MKTLLHTQGQRLLLMLCFIVMASAALSIWLSCPFKDAPAPGYGDLIYVAAGAGDQPRRVIAAVAVADQFRFTSIPLTILLGDDRTRNRWSRADQTNWTTVEWSMRDLRDRLSKWKLTNVTARILARSGHGTAAEMKALAAQPELIESDGVALVSSPYHMRRLDRQFRLHVKGVAPLYAPARWEFSDFMPWVTVPEFFKLCRDYLGLTDEPILSRWACGHAWGWADVVVLLSLLVLVYAWVAYPVLLGVVATLKGKPSGQSTGFRPARVDVLIAAHNEEAVIETRLENLLRCLATAGVADVAWIHVGVDASLDRTWEIVAKAGAANPRIVPREFRDRTGKTGILKAMAADCGYETAPADHLFLFTDANTYFAPDAVEFLLAPFADPTIGGVCGRLVFVQDPRRMEAGSSGSSEGAYWTYETWLKERESDMDSCLGANGAIYAIRQKSFWRDLPVNTVVDDFVLGMKVREAGGRMRYEPRAVAWEELPDEFGEWGRRVRIGAGDWQAVSLCRGALKPSQGWFAISFFSHKLLRWVTPQLLVLLFLFSAWITVWGLLDGCGGEGCEVRLLISGLMSVMLLAAGSLALPAAASLAGNVKALRLLRHFMLMQAALLVGFTRYCRGGLKGHWQRTARS